MGRHSQHIFDAVVNHLRTQRAHSVALNPDGSQKMEAGNVVCLYRSAKGKMKCAAGAAITDEEYKPEMEGKNIRAVVDEFKLVRLDAHVPLLNDLQRAHDFYPVEDWESLFQDTARRFDLIYTPPTP